MLEHKTNRKRGSQTLGFFNNEEANSNPPARFVEPSQAQALTVLINDFLSQRFPSKRESQKKANSNKEDKPSNPIEAWEEYLIKWIISPASLLRCLMHFLMARFANCIFDPNR